MKRENQVDRRAYLRGLPWLSILVFGSIIVNAQDNSFKAIDPETKTNLTISGFCLCETKLTELKHLADLGKIEVEEMDYPEKCGGSDMRFTGGSGVYSGKYPGMIFQEGNVEGIVGKIRLTKEFKGKLPNGAAVDLSTMKLRDVFAIYPELNESWGSRGCSDYWNFSDKTISFYVKIDKSIQPQFPIRESDYLDKPVEGIDLVASCSKLLLTSKPIQFFRPDEPMFFVDSIRTNESFIEEAYTPDEIALVTVIKGDNAVRIGGDEAKNGIIYITTKHFARTTYWNLFRSVSPSYAAAVQSQDDTDIVYVLNDNVLTENAESELFPITRNNLVDIKVIDRKQLKKQFDKKGRVGVILKIK
jgi:hypothetical protein